LAGEVERCFQAWPVELGAGRSVFVVGDDPLVLLDLAERLQPFVLGGQRGRLVLLVGADSAPPATFASTGRRVKSSLTSTG
jgi:hypothetical protein